MKRYSLVRADHPSNLKRGGVCIYYKESLGVCIIDFQIKQSLFFVKFQ